MRTRLKASCVVGFDGRSHVYWRDGEVVFSGERIEFVGRGFSGHVDREVDYGQALIGPGFIDLDALGDIDTGVLTVDNGSKLENGRLWSEDYLRRGPTDAFTLEEEVFKYRYAFTHLLRNGITTALPITSMYYRAWAEHYDEFAAVAAVAGELGIRAYLGPCYMGGITYVRADRSLGQHWDEARGRAGLEQALRFLRDVDGSFGGRVRGMLAPDRIETCTPELLARTAAASAESGAPIRLHCCQSVYEFQTVWRLRGQTPLGWLEQLGLLTPRAILPHGIYLSGHPDVPVQGTQDWQRLAGSGASIAHCPAVFARTGEALDSFGAYRAAGINIGLGTDTWPADLLHNMQLGLYLARVMEGPQSRRHAEARAAAAEAATKAATNGGRTGTAAATGGEAQAQPQGGTRAGAEPDVLAPSTPNAGQSAMPVPAGNPPSIGDLYDAATLGGARALGREDLGRLAPGAQADIVVFDLRASHLGPLFDPLKNLFLAGRGTDCRASYVAGRCVMEDFRVLAGDPQALQPQADRQFARLLAHQQQRRFDAAPPAEVVQPVFPWRVG